MVDKMDRRTFLKKSALLTAASAFGLNFGCQKQNKPNIIFILADDLGYGDLGCFGQDKIETPNIDALAKQGMRFTQFYSASPVCAPARCSFLTGKHGGHAYIRGNDAWKERGDVWNFTKVVNDPYLEGQRPIPAQTLTLSKVLKKAGYKTALIGKWGLGGPLTDGAPNKQGFDFFFGYNCQRQAHTYFPKHLWKNNEKIWLDNPLVPPHSGFDKGADPYDPQSYAKFNLKQYAPDLMFKELIQFVEENHQNPFFLYWATPIPHVPLQAPQRWVDYYVKKFGDEKPYLGDKGYFPCRYPHATYAAMISYLDEQVGLLIQKLKELGIYQNTLIIFTSDNGPTYAGGADTPWFKSCGPLNDDLQKIKGHVYEGGIRVPFIATWKNHISKNSECKEPTILYDMFPTFCDIVQVQKPAGLDGVSLLPLLLGQKKEVDRTYLYWEFVGYGGQQAIRMGKWKGIRNEISKGNTKIELYDLENDLKELNNVAAQHPDIVAEISEIMKAEHQPADLPVFRLKTLDSLSNS